MVRPVSVKFTWNGLSKSIWVSPGMSLGELSKTLCASFGLPDGCIGSLVSSGKEVKLERICRNPSQFINPVCLVVVEENVEEDDDVTTDDEEGIPSIFSFSTNEIKVLIRMFQTEQARDGRIDWETFFAVFKEFSKKSQVFKNVKKERLGMILRNLFSVFDQDGNGIIDYTEFLSGLTVLCDGTRDEKIRIAFDLYDFDKDGFISMPEMKRYLKSVFTVMQETSSEVFDRHGVSAEELADITAEQCFLEADTNHDGKLSFNEFKVWYSVEHGKQQLEVSQVPLSLSELSHLLKLDQLNASDVLEAFSEVAHDGSLNRNRFRQSLLSLIRNHGMTLDRELSGPLLDQVFGVFDQDKNGLVDFEELGAGISILCRGSRDDKVRAAFSLYDYNNDGYITMDEMINYMGSVFRMLYETQPEVRGSMNGVDAEELGEITARQCFLEADIDRDGRLSFEEFQAWYGKPTSMKQVENRPQLTRQSSSLADYDIDLAEIQRVTGLDSLAVFDVFRFFGSRAVGGVIDRSGFRDAFNEIRVVTGRSTSPKDKMIYDTILNRLFEVFDDDGNGTLDFVELASGLAVVCPKESDEAARETFRLFDADGDGFITKQEMERYLASVFKMSAELSKEQRDNPHALAAISTEECFLEADKNKDGKLSYQEFSQWFNEADSPMSVQMVQQVTGLGSISLEDAFDAFSEAIDDVSSTSVSRSAFNDVIFSIAPPDVDVSLLRKVAGKLFDAFDIDHSGGVDFSELVGGLSILCKGNEESKTAVAFALYDLNGDGFISKPEMTKYLASVFTIVFTLEPAKRSSMSPLELAVATTENIFAEADVNKDNKLSYDEFQKWFNNGGNGLSLDQIRELTRLSFYTPEEAFEIFAAYSNEEGLLSMKGFRDSFKEILAGSGMPVTKEEFQKMKVVMQGLFQVFDADGDGVVDFAELSSGLSVLCGGGEDDRALAAFKLYDSNGDGFISLDEMKRYLTCVFRVMYSTQPGIQTQTGGASPLQLAEATAESIFEEIDLNKDGKLSFIEFQRWYSGNSGQGLSVAANIMAADDSWFSVSEIQRLTNIDRYSPDEILEEFINAAVERPRNPRLNRFNSNMYVSRESFDQVFEDIVGDDTCETEDDFVRLTFIMDRLYDMFDTDSDGQVDFSELAAGLAVLCGGDQDSKIIATFRLFDQDGDGYITQQEMRAYLTSVYKVLFASQPQVQASAHGLGAEELALVTAQQCFVEADTNVDGKLSFEEFRSWYSRPAGQAVATIVNQVPQFVSLEEIRTITRLDQYDPEDMKDQIMQFADRRGMIDRPGFLTAFEELIGETDISSSEITRCEFVLNRLFDIFDTDRNGCIDIQELTAGLSILCGGSKESKMSAAFDNYDLDGDGTISLHEMTRYLTAVFKIMYETKHGTAQRVGISAEALAVATAASIFQEADVNQDGHLDLEEFKKWYDTENNVVNDIVTEAPSWISLASIRELTRLDQFAPSDVFEFFATRCSNGEVDRQTFEYCFRDIAMQKSPAMTSSEMDRLHLVMNRLFDAFDTNKSGVVEFTDLVSGLSVLCGGNKHDRAEAAFELYDYNGDGFISYEEMLSYLTSVFKVMFQLEPSSTNGMAPGTTPYMVADATAQRIFAEADVNHDGRLSFNEFRAWYSQTTVKPLSLSDARTLTGLANVEAADVFEEFAENANEDGGLSKEAFVESFVPFVAANVQPDRRQRAFEVVDTLFGLFDQDKNGSIDFIELASGLSVLCGGTTDSKAEAVFRLYDHDNTGFVSRESMEWYLTSVFRLMYETRPGTQQRVGGVDPVSLAVLTTEQIFGEADLNNDGLLSFEEFKAWYSSDAIVQDASNSVTVDEIRRLTGFGGVSQHDLFEEFALVVNDDGLIGPNEFKNVCLKMVQNRSLTIEERQRLPVVLNKLFQIFDLDNNGMVDFSELASGVGILCNDPRDAKAEAAFALYDEDGDGFINLSEMIRYLSSVFKVMYETNPNMAAQADGLSPSELAQLTAEQIFIDADINHDGKLSFDEFKAWYSESAEEEAPVMATRVSSSSNSSLSLSDIQKITGFYNLDIHDVFEVFANYTNDAGVLNRAAFDGAFDKVTSLSNDQRSSVEQEKLESVKLRLFDIFDIDGNGVVDFSEISTGLSVLCGGTPRVKTEAAFALYDTDGDGFIARSELERYLTCIFKVMYETAPANIMDLSVSPEQIASATAEDIMKSADTNDDGKLSFDEFQKWYEGDGAVVNNMQSFVESNIPIDEARRVTGLDQLTPEEAFQEFAFVTGPDGTISRVDFFRTFRKFIVRKGEVDDVKREMVISRLFTVFDADGNGEIDFSELASGLSILCQGDKGSKVRAAFSLFDVDSDGFISKEEMQTYLLAVFRVLFELMPSTKNQVDVSAEDLARATTEQCFEEADIDHDGKLSFDEFSTWFSTNGEFFPTSNETTKETSVGGLQEIKRLTKLEHQNVGDVMKLVQSMTGGSDSLSFQEFVSLFEMLVERGGGHSNYRDQEAAAAVIRQMFNLFDQNLDGLVDFRELSSGLSVLCGGSREEKVESAFALYDYDGDGFISLEEMVRYLTSVFKVLYTAQPDTAASMEVSPEQLGVITAEQCFLEADTNQDGKLSFDEFKAWYAGQY